MKNIRRTLSAIMALSMLSGIVGCSDKANVSKKNPEEKKGGYTEENVNFDSKIEEMTELIKAGDKISFFDITSGTKYDMAKGDTGFSTDNSAVAAKLSTFDNIIDVCFGPDGECFVIYLDSNTYNSIYAYIDKDGNDHAVKCDDLLFSAEFSSDGKLYAGALGTIYEINTDSYTSKEVLAAGSETVGFDIIGNNVILIDELGAHIYDYSNKKEVEVPEVLNNFFKERKNDEYTGDIEFDMCEGEDGSMYIVARDGIFRYAMDGNQIEQIIDGATCSVGNPSYHPKSIALDDNGVIYVGFKEGIMTKYMFDGEKVNSASKKLKVYSLEKNNTLSQIINTFSAENKDIKVDYQVGLKSGMTYSDAMKNLTTQILSGDAPDIIMLDGLDIDNLIDKNLLMDLKESESQWNSNSALMDNIVKWNEKDSKLYSVACKFRIPAVGADKDVLKDIKSYSDIADYAEKTRSSNKGSYAIVSMTEPEVVIKNALIYTGSDIISSKGIDESKLAALYEDCCKIYKNDQPDDEIIVSGSINDVPPVYDFASKLTSAISDPKAVALGTLNTFDCDYNLATSLNNYDQPTNVEFRMGMTEGSKIFLPSCNLGIVDASKEKESAVKFINTALSDAQQKIENTDGFPVNKNALEYFYNKKSEGDNDATLGIADGNGEVTGKVNVEWIDKDEAKQFDEYINKLDTPLVINDVIMDILLQSGKNCLEGSSSASDAANEAVKQLQLKMKEG